MKIKKEIQALYTKLPEHIIPLQKSMPPYMPVDVGYYGYQGIMLLDKTLDRVQCHVCGRWFKSVGAHLRKHQIHHLTYKERFGLYRTESLMSLNTKRLHRLSKGKHPENLIPNRGKKLTPDFTKVVTGKNGHDRTAFQNRWGTCEAQLKFRLTEEIKKFGRIPKTSETKLVNLFTKRFGSWDKGLQYYKIKNENNKASV